jgi:hypothetical protein
MSLISGRPEIPESQSERSSVTLAEKRLKDELKNDLHLRKLWRKIEKISRVSACPILLDT